MLSQKELELLYDQYQENAVSKGNRKPVELYSALHTALEEYVAELQKNAWIDGYLMGRGNTHDC